MDNTIWQDVIKHELQMVIWQATAVLQPEFLPMSKMILELIIFRTFGNIDEGFALIHDHLI